MKVNTGGSWNWVEATTFCRLQNRGVTDTPKGYAVVQRNLEKLEKRDSGNLTKFRKEKDQVPHLRGKNNMDKYRDQVHGEGP